MKENPSLSVLLLFFFNNFLFLNTSICFPPFRSFVVKVNPSLSFGVSEIRRTFHLHLFGFFVCLIVFETKRTTEINYLLITKKRGISGIYKYLLRPIFKRIYPVVYFCFFVCLVVL